MKPSCYDAVVIGGGFYGCTIALFLREHLDSVLLVEQESDLLTRASLVNQARVHNGYHYPRSFVTALRSFINFPRFTKEFEDCIDSTFEQYYAVATAQSKTNALQFLRVFRNLGIPIKPARAAVKNLFSRTLIEDVFLTTEYAFDAVALRHRLGFQMERAGIEVRLNTTVEHVASRPNGELELALADETVCAQRVYNCTYSGINRLLRASGLVTLPMKHELAEIALCHPPREIEGMGITVMDGPFFSTMPFPARRIYSFSHVRYTPHTSWRDDETNCTAPQQDAVRTNFPFMVRDAARYMPCLADSVYVDSLFDTKTVLVKNEVDDGRPILFREHHGLKNLYVIMGGKIDNIYDILQILENKQAVATGAVR
jgi:glycine/D-amino acid oxidase-like deaminating enzyme